MKEPLYQQLFLYYNTSFGVKPVIAKLPTTLQSKWMTRVMQYKMANGVVFPPFSVLCSFVREMSMWYNDPAFSYQTDMTAATTSYTTGSNHGQYNKAVVNVIETEVSGSYQKCPHHQESTHSLKDCLAFRKKSLAERKKILQENNICFKCCASNTHGQQDCQVIMKCDICVSESHLTAMHIESHPTANKNQPHTQQPQQPKENHGGETKQASFSNKNQPNTHQTQQTSSSNKIVANKCTKICGKGLQGRSCAKIVPVEVYPANNPDKAMKVYAILDDQSNGSLARSTLFDAMDLTETDSFDYTLTSYLGQKDRKGRRTFDLMVQSQDGNATFKLPPIVECDDISNERGKISTPEIASQFEHLRNLDLPPQDPDAEILLLIGRDMTEAHTVLEQLTSARSDPFAQHLALG